MVRGASAAERKSRLTPWCLRAILAALVIAVLAPAMATAEPGAPVAPEVVPAPTDAEVPTGDPAESPAPADETTPPPASEEPPPASEEQPPVPPPAAEENSPTEPTSPPAPPAETTSVPPTSEGPAAPPAPAEATPASATTTPLPAVPDAPRARVDGTVIGAAIVDAGLGAPPKVVPLLAVKVTGGPSPPPAIAVSTLGTPTAPPDASAPAGPPPAARRDAPPVTELSPSLLETPPAPTAPARRDAVGRGEASSPGTNPFDTLAASGGPAPAGSSLLAVLASYVLPGAGAPPGTMLLLFVQLAVILAAFFAPRPGLGERALALARLGPRTGYRTVLARPG